MHWEDVDLVAVIFHELAHQVLYVKGDSEFNESFATAVEEFGIERWLSSRNQQTELTSYRERRELRERLMQHIAEARTDLEAIYSASISSDEMRLQKNDRFERLNRDLAAELESSGRESPTWLNDGLNNARLASMSLYHGRLAEFRALFTECSDDIQCFYARADDLANGERDVSHRK